MKLSVHFLWFDFWVGAFWDRAKRILYVCPLPCVVLKFDFGHEQRQKLAWVDLANKAFHDKVLVERDKAVADLERLKKNIGIDKCEYVFCADTTCPHHNPRT